MQSSCSRPGCSGRGVAQLTYAYPTSQVEVCPVDDRGGRGACILCQTHLDRLTLPKGWTLILKGLSVSRDLTPAEVDALADEVRRVGGLGVSEPVGTESSLSRRANLVMLTSRAHLRVVADAVGYASAAEH